MLHVQRTLSSYALQTDNTHLETEECVPIDGGTHSYRRRYAFLSTEERIPKHIRKGGYMPYFPTYSLPSYGTAAGIT